MRNSDFLLAIVRSRRSRKIIGALALLAAVALAVLLTLPATPAYASIGQPAQPGVITWTGNGDGTRWADPANWDAGRLPRQGDIVRITSTSPNQVINAPVIGVIGGLELDAGFYGTLRLQQPVRIMGDLVIQNGTLDSGSASLWISGAVRASGGVLITPRTVMRSNTMDIQSSGVVRLGVNGKLELAGDGSPLTGAGLLDVMTNRPNSVEFIGNATSNLDQAGPAAALRSTSVSYRAMQQLAAAASNAPLSPAAPKFAEAGASLTLSPTEDGLTSAVIDTANGFAYFGTFTASGKVVKVNLKTFTRVGVITLNTGEDVLNSAVIDTLHNYAYFGTLTVPGQVVKINLATFTRVGALTLQPGEDYLASAVIDPANNFAYFGTLTIPGIVVKVGLNGAFTPTEVMTLPLSLANHEESLNTAVIDTANGFAYFAAADADAITPGPDSVVKVNLSTFTRDSGLLLNVGEMNLTAAVIDPAHDYAYFASSTSPINIIKVQLSTMTESGATLQPFDPAWFQVYAGVIDPIHGFAYFGASSQPGIIAKIDLSSFTTAQTLTLQAGEDFLSSAVIDPANSVAYFGAGTAPGIVAAVYLGNDKLTLTTSTNPAVFGQPITFTAVVSPAGITGTPTGIVTFTMDNGATVTRTLSAGAASYTTSTLTVATHTITATYGGDTTFDVVFNTITQTVNKAATIAGVTSSSNPSVFGQVVTFTATITRAAPSIGTPSGTVTFTIDNVVVAAPTLINSVARYVTSTLAVATHTVRATYGGDSGFITSTVLLAPSQVVSKAGTTTSVASSFNPSVFGQPVTFTATVTPVAPGSGTPTGVVTYSIDGARAATSTLSGGVGTFVTSTLAVGSHTVVITYSGSASFVSSNASLPTQVVTKANTTVNVASSSNSSVFGQSVTFTATVAAASPGVGTPAGTVTFTIDGINAGTGALNNGVASLSTGLLAPGAHPVQVVYGGNTNFNGNSGALSPDQLVNPANTTTSVASSPNPSVFGQTVRITATVAAVPPGAGTPTGVATFSIDGVVLGTPTLSGGVATFSSTLLAVGTHAISVTYGGSANFNTSTGTLAPAQVVGKANSATSVASLPNPSVYGQSVTFTATVTAVTPGAGTPSSVVTFTSDGVLIGTATLSGGVATVSASSLPVGTHTVTVTYSGDVNFNSSLGTLAPNQVVAKAGTTTSVASSLNASVFGQSVTFTATVAVALPGAGSPSGVVSFTIDGSSAGTVTLSGGVATVSTSSLGAGSHTVVAAYGGDGSFNGSSGSLSPTQVVSKSGTTTIVASSLTPIVFGQSVTFTATVTAVAPGVGTPTGTVTFTIDGSTASTAAVSGGLATFSTSSLGVASHTVSVSYSGDANFSISTSSALNQVVNKADSATSVASSSSSSVYGQAVTFTATVAALSPGAGTPSGVVTFTIGAGAPVTVALNGGVAAYSTSTLPVGTTTVTVAYGGDTNFNNSSGTLSPNQTVAPANTTTSVDSSSNASVFGQTVSITATVAAVSPGAGTPTGQATFTIDGAMIVTPTLSGGVATYVTSTLAVGAHAISVTYGGSTNFNSSTGNLSPTQVVNLANSTTTVSSSSSPTVYGQSVTFTATVAAVSPSAGTPSGVVTFTIDGNTIVAPTLIGGIASYITSSLPVGTHTVAVTYSGDTGFNGSTGTLAPNQVVNQAGTTTSVASSLNASVFGDAVTFTATVAAVAPGVGTPSGAVTFTIDGVDVGTATLNSGVATLLTSTLGIGSHAILVTYGGDLNFIGSSGSLSPTQFVARTSTATSVVSSQSPSTYGQSVTFTATVTVIPSGVGTPTGAVTFTIDGVAVGTINLSGGVATFSTSALGVGSRAVVVSYGGDTNYNASTSTPVLTQVVNKAGSTTAVTASPSPSTYGQSVTFTATVAAVAPAVGAPTGTVTFTIDGIAVGTINLSGGVATFSTTALVVGSRAVVVSYSGDTNFNASTSTPVLTQAVNKADTTTSVDSFPNSSVFGQSVTFTATVAALSPGAGTPAGVVTFTVDGAAMGTATLSAGVASYSTSALSGGSHSISVTYDGDSSFNGSTGALAVNQVVNQASPSMTITSSLNPSTQGKVVTFTVTLLPPAFALAARDLSAVSLVAPTGTVSITINGAVVATPALNSGIAVYSTTLLAAGTNTVTVQYAGDQNYSGSTATLSPKQLVLKIVAYLPIIQR